MQRLTGDDPDVIGPYRLVARIGEGGMGVVYLAEAAEGGNVAVKVLREFLARDQAFRARFQREVSACMRVGGVCCAHFVAADADAGLPWLATEYVPGPNLADHVAHRGPLSNGMLAGFAAGVAEALAAIHAADLVHRDLKPSNVILSAEGPRVIDFGIAHHPEATSLTATGIVIGSPGWMAPEQLRGDKVGPAADVWAWGATVAYAATGRAPFGTGPAPEVAQRVLSGYCDVADVPQPLADHVRVALAVDPSVRPTAADLVTALTGSEEPNAITAVLARTWESPGVTASLPAVGSRRRRWLIAAGAASAAVVAAVIFAVLTTGGGSPSRSPSSAATGGATPRSAATSTAASTPTATDPWGMANFRPSANEESMSDVFRAFSGQPNYIPDFPLTMNGCATRAMRTHWRSLGKAMTFGKVFYSDSPETATEADAMDLKNATGGWIDTGGCEQPVFFVSDDVQGNLVDVTFETRMYDAAP
jgi:serine/threonine protein kinase